MTTPDNRALWELVYELRDVESSDGDRAYDCGFETAHRQIADKLAAILERPVVVGDGERVDSSLYASACESAEEWKQRALAAEELLNAMQESNFPTFMGDPVIPGIPHTWVHSGTAGITYCVNCSAKNETRRGRLSCTAPESMVRGKS